MTLPCELACWSRIRHAGSAGSKRIAAARFGATATIAARAATVTCPGVDLDASVRPADRAHGSIEDDALAELLRHPQRDELRAADDAVGEALLGREELVRPTRARDRPRDPAGARTSTPAS